MRISHALLVMLAFPLAGCPSTVVRETKVLKAEMNWFNRASMQQAKLLRRLIETHPACKCDEVGARFTEPLCQKAAKTLLTAQHRSPYHRDMALYNAGIIKKRPSRTPPAIPPVSTLCTPKVK